MKNSKGVPPQPSSRQHKDNIQELKSEDALEALQGLNPDTVTYNEEALSNDRKGLYAMDIVAVLTKVVQAQQKTITDMRDELNELKAKVM